MAATLCTPSRDTPSITYSGPSKNSCTSTPSLRCPRPLIPPTRVATAQRTSSRDQHLVTPSDPADSRGFTTALNSVPVVPTAAAAAAVTAVVEASDGDAGGGSEGEEGGGTRNGSGASTVVEAALRGLDEEARGANELMRRFWARFTDEAKAAEEAAAAAASAAAADAAAASAAHIEPMQPGGAVGIVIQPILQSILKARSWARSVALVCCTDHLPKPCLSETNCFTVMKPNDSAISISCAAVRTHHSYLGVLAALRFIGTMIVLCFHIFNHTDDVSPGCGSYIGAHATLAAQT
mmetsp:Transcript_64409/g.120732  ORF Transcript_64409/g.120732 Transcript_64409/m.120732 type:complete len:294 (+) Transcript_64409:942-1823(+)